MALLQRFSSDSQLFNPGEHSVSLVVIDENGMQSEKEHCR